MQLTKFRVQNFRCVEDSGEIDVENLTCLVGKNEAGKTALLEALYAMRPCRGFEMDKTRDYPRRFLTKFDERHPEGEAEVIRTWWDLSPEDVAAVTDEFGKDILKSQAVQIYTGIGYDGTHWYIEVDEEACVKNAISQERLSATEKAQVHGVDSTSGFVAKVKEIGSPSDKLANIMARFKKFRDNRATLRVIDILSERMPRFFYTSHYERMSGEISLSQLAQDQKDDSVSIGDRIFLDFINYAGTSIDELNNAEKHEELVAQCEAASNDITDEMLSFWSQNDALSIKIDIGVGKPNDPSPFNKGTVAKIRIWNENHRASVPLSERSAGFVWFFSFLSQFKQLSQSAGNVIVLLDEPGLTLHGKAQSDLLKYIKERLLPNHQVVYTTHSPFLVPANELAKVRVVEDVVEYKEDRSSRGVVKGTKVSSEVLSVDKDTLFPLQGHLGYEITQSLFIGENTLLVEGPSDILYLQVASSALKARGRTALDPRWIICPSGGIDKVFSFVSLFSGNKLNMAVLADFGKGQKKKIERLRQSQILAASRVLTTTEFTEKEESDIEDFFDESLFSSIINEAFGLSGKHKLDADRLKSADESTVRLVKKAEAYFRTLPAEAPEFDHFSPSRFLLQNPRLLDGDSDPVKATLGRFEKAFDKINTLI